MTKILTKLISLFLVLVFLIVCGITNISAANNIRDYISKDGLWKLDIICDEKSENYGYNFLYEYYGTEKTVTLPEVIDDNIMKGMVITNDNIENLIVPRQYQKIGQVYGKKKLKTVTFSREYEDGELKLFDWAMFGKCKNLKKVILPNKLPSHSHINLALKKSIDTVYLPEYTFNECRKLEEVVLPDNLEEIGMDAFCYCESLNTITIPEGVKYIDAGAFTGCIGLETVYLPDSLEVAETNFGNAKVIMNHENEELKLHVKEENIIIEEPSVVVPGDINGDTKLNEVDINLVQSYIANDLDYDISSKADYNKDGKVDVSDVTYMQLSIEGKYTPPEGEETEATFKPLKAATPKTDSETPGENKVQVQTFFNGDEIGRETYNTGLNDSIKVEFKLKSNQLIANTNGLFNYDKKVLKLKSFKLSDKLKNVYTSTNGSVTRFNNSQTTDLADFKGEDVFATAEFEFLDSDKNAYVSLNLSDAGTIIDNTPAFMYKNGNLLETGNITVTSELTEPIRLYISAEEKTVEAGKTFKIKIKRTDNNAIPITEDITFSSDNKECVLVKKNIEKSYSKRDWKTNTYERSYKYSGLVYPLQKGEATITAKAMGETFTCKVNVTTTPKAFIKQNGKWVKLNPKKTYTFTKYKSGPLKGDYRPITLKLQGKVKNIKNIYYYSTKKVVRVPNRFTSKPKIEVKKKGKATIKIKVNRVKTFKIKVKVK